YCAAEPRWCPGCGDHSVLNAVQRLARQRQMPPEQTVVVSGIGCSSRFPHYMKTYGFHGLHGRALPVACGVRSRRPDLNLFVVTGDGDCCAIGMGHWVHAMRYNMDMTILLLDNHIYGLTKKQTSPTTGKGSVSNTHPQGSFFVPLNPITLALGISNVSFVAQTVDWNPPHVYATIQAAHEHKGTSFVRIFQRCPHFTHDVFAEAQKDPSQVLMMTHEDGIQLAPEAAKLFKNQTEHDPSDLQEAREIASHEELFPIGLFYRNPQAERYENASVAGMGMSPQEKLTALERALDRFTI
ncbi:MAG TPA: thiamine pyrophosphate-dependent enzyme, partial [Acidobacteriota bacterium]|nr:thiamine pyrophosphate-dependent enzyme [Acidobacteriota bacterium]